MTRWLLLLLCISSLSACALAAPPCVGLSPEHSTRDGVVEVGPLANGEQAEDVVILRVSPIEGVPGDGNIVVYSVEQEDADCPATLQCSPEEVDVGQSLRCTVTAEASAESCTSRIDLVLRVTQDDDAVCTDVVRSEQIEVDQVN